MTKPDVICSWPHHADYPLFRQMILENRKYFDHVYVVFTQSTMPDPHFNRFLLKNVPYMEFISPPDSVGDWRNTAINYVLDHYSKAKNVLFLEQDFLIRDKRFWEVLFRDFEHNFIYYQEGERIHPACALVTREVIDRTSRDFTARPPLYDHFGLFFREVNAMANGINIEDLGLHSNEDYYHMAGFTQNYYCIQNNQPLYKPEEFLAYNHYVQKVNVLQHPVYVETSQLIERLYGSGDKDGFIRSFFPKNETN